MAERAKLFSLWAVATESDTLAGGTRPHPKAPVTEVGRDLQEATCRSCRTQLGLDSDGGANQRLDVVHVWRSANRSVDTKTP